ncbi:hypothetical protein ES703_49405 [subsurface metagenome]
MKELEILASNIKRHRHLQGLQQKQLAAKVGISSDYLSKFERAAMPNIGMKLLSRFANVLGVETSALLRNDDEATPMMLVISEQNFKTLKRLFERILEAISKIE